MWCYRKLLKINWVDILINEKVLNLVNEKRSLYTIAKKRRYRLMGHTLSHEGLVGKIPEGALEGR